MRDPPKILTDEKIERLMRPARIPAAWKAEASEDRRAAKVAADKFLRGAETNNRDLVGESFEAYEESPHLQSDSLKRYFWERVLTQDCTVHPDFPFADSSSQRIIE